jgi:hypothetical protein
MQYLANTPGTLLRLILDNYITYKELSNLNNIFADKNFFKYFYPEIQFFLEKRELLSLEYQNMLATKLKSYFEKGALEIIRNLLKNDISKNILMYLNSELPIEFLKLTLDLCINVIEKQLIEE